MFDRNYFIIMMEDYNKCKECFFDFREWKKIFSEPPFSTMPSLAKQIFVQIEFKIANVKEFIDKTKNKFRE